MKKTIDIQNGKRGRKKFFYWSEYESYEEAHFYAQKIKAERQKEGKIRYFIVEEKEGWFLPAPKFILYLDKNLRVI